MLSKQPARGRPHTRLSRTRKNKQDPPRTPQSRSTQTSRRSKEGGEKKHAIAKHKPRGQRKKADEAQADSSDNSVTMTDSDKGKKEVEREGKGPAFGVSYNKKPQQQQQQTKIAQATITTTYPKQTQKNNIERGRKTPVNKPTCGDPDWQDPGRQKGQDRKADIPNHVAIHPTPRSQNTPRGSRGQSRYAKGWGTRCIYKGERFVSLQAENPKQKRSPKNNQPYKNITLSNKEQPWSDPVLPRGPCCNGFLGTEEKPEVVYRL